MEGNSARIIGADKRFAGIERNTNCAMQAKSSDPVFIVRFVPFNAPAPTDDFIQTYCMDADSAREEVLRLVRSGTALAENVAVYANTGWFANVSIEQPPPSPATR